MFVFIIRLDRTLDRSIKKGQHFCGFQNHMVSVSGSSDVVVSDCCIQTNIHEGNQASIELSAMRF